MKKDAYLIMSHKIDMTLLTLLRMLDSPMNDIYIHMDKKCKVQNINESIPKLIYSNIIFTERTSVAWGGFSQINAELILIKEATKNNSYRYYHLISGEDLPLKTAEYIYNFFDKNKGKHYIRFSKKFEGGYRVRYWYLFQECIGRKRNCYWLINKILIILQKVVGVNRNKDVTFFKGTNWFSITDDLARYVLSQEDWIKKTFKYTFMCDEVFLHTIVQNSHFKDTLFYNKPDNSLKSIMRVIDWERGKPYIFRSEDYEDLVASDMLFARKFDCQVDSEIISQIASNIGV